MNLLVLDIEDVYLDFINKNVEFRNGVMNNEIIRSVKDSNTICIINKIDKKSDKFPENVVELNCKIENLKQFVFISCKDLLNIPNLIFTLKKNVYHYIF